MVIVPDLEPRDYFGVLVQWVAPPTADAEVITHKFESQLGHITLVEIDHEIISMTILPLLLIQEGQLSVTGASMCTKYWLTAQGTKPPQEKVSRWTDWLDMTLTVLTGLFNSNSTQHCDFGSSLKQANFQTISTRTYPMVRQTGWHFRVDSNSA